jgi:CheY-like chemotaxis protein
MPKILVVDDDAAVRDAFRLALEDMPVEVMSATDAEAGVALGSQEQIALVILDLRMPGRDGVSALEALRETGYRAPIVIVTGFADEFTERLEEARATGLAFDLLTKPLDRNQIRGTVKRLLADGRP